MCYKLENLNRGQETVCSSPTETLSPGHFALLRYVMMIFPAALLGIFALNFLRFCIKTARNLQPFDGKSVLNMIHCFYSVSSRFMEDKKRYDKL